MIRYQYFILFILLAIGPFTPAQVLKPTMNGMHALQREGSGKIRINFKPNGPLNRDWIYGSYIDEDSITRYAAYREGGRWVPLPVTGNYGGYATDVEMCGDTVCVAGRFWNFIRDKDSSSLPYGGVIKYYQDSVWTDFPHVSGALQMATKGDSMIFIGGSYYRPPQIIYRQYMTPDAGKTWQYPFSIRHPTDTGSFPSFGPPNRLEILDNGDVLILNDEGPANSPYKGIIRWDGQQWHTFGNNAYAFATSKAYDFEFYRGELYLGGIFANYYTYYGDTTDAHPHDPGNSIVRWDGSQWQGLGGGIMEGGVLDIMVYNDILYCQVRGGSYKHHKFGDALIPYFAGWDGKQWCGTPIGFDNMFTSPMSVGWVNDTLYFTFDFTNGNYTIDGFPITNMMYFDGDYVNGPNAICSTLGLDEEKPQPTPATFEFYPNPARDEIKISGAEEIRSLKIYDMAGRCVLQRELNSKNLEVKLDVSGLVPGIYLLEVNGGVQRKFVRN